MNRAVLAALVSLTLSGAVRAQDSADDAKKAAILDEARQHAASAKVHYDLGEFDKAAEEYVLVYRAKPIPAILYNIAQAYRQAAKYEKAKQFYKAYLREMPDGKNRVQVQKAIKEINELLAKETKARDLPPTGITQSPVLAPSSGTGRHAPPTMPDTGPMQQTAQGAAAQPEPVGKGPAFVATTEARPPPVVAAASPAQAPPALSMKTPLPNPGKSVSSTQRTWSYVLAGTSAALLIGGTGFAMTSKNYNDELLARSHSTASADALSSTASSAGKISTLLFVTGLAAAAGAGVLYFVPFSSGAGVGGQF